jgi:hypothetical protein
MLGQRAIKERLIWPTADALRAVADVGRWPFERVVWAVEQRLVWPLRERTAELSAPLRFGSAAGLAAAAIAAGAFGVLAATDGGSADPAPTLSAVPAASAEPQREAVAEEAPILRGVAPDFTPKGEGGTTKVGDAEAIAKAPDSDATASSSPDKEAAPIGPAAIEVAHRFAGAFVRYETGEDGTKVRTALHRTATPQLARALLQRPPRLPANVEVPKAKVLNVVPGPAEAGVHTISVSLLRVGLTSELRLDMERDEKNGEWQVTDVLG